MKNAPILVPLDGSKFAEVALGWAETLARAEEREIVALSAVETRFEGVMPERLERDEVLEQARGRSAHRYVKGMAEALSKKGLSARGEVAIGGAANIIVREAASLGAAMIVMATHGRGGIERWALGSVADKVMRLSERPTLLVRPSETSLERAARIEQVMVPLDGSTLSEGALEPAAAIAASTGAHLTLLRVVPFLTSMMDWGSAYVTELTEIENEMREDAQQGLEESRKRIPASADVSLVVLNGPPAIEIEDFISEHRIDLTVMTTHGRGGLARLVLGSTAERLVHAGDPVLLVHPKEG